MKIGLIRHFKVNNTQPKFMSSKDFAEWVNLYDNADVIKNEIDIKKEEWNKCFTSDLPRAIKTAETLYKGKIIKTDQLREVPLSPIFNTNIKLHYLFWNIGGRIAWLFSHKSQSEGKKETQKRIKKFLDRMENEGVSNNLIICHGFLMHWFQRELIKRGFRGHVSKNIKNGKLYLFEK